MGSLLALARRWPSLVGPVLCTTLGWFVQPSVGAAQVAGPCGLSGRNYETFPGSGASRVALDAPLRVRLSEPFAQPPAAAELATALALHGPLEEGELGPARAGTVYFLGSDTFWFEPAAPLAPGARYALVLSPVVAGERVTVEFQTGAQVDQGPPVFPFDPDAVAFRTQRAPEDCGLPEGTYLVDMAIPYALDDADDGAIEYLVYLTRAQGLAGPRLLDRTRRQGQEVDPNIRFALSPEEALAPVCVAFQVRDGTLKQASSEAEYCFDPVDTAYFHSMCQAGGRLLPRAGARRAIVAGSCLFLVSLLLLRWRGTRRAPRPR